MSAGPLRPLASFGYPPMEDGIGGEIGDPVALGWLDELDVVMDGPRTTIDAPHGLSRRHQALHLVRDERQRLWMLTVTRPQQSLTVSVSRTGPFDDFARMAGAMQEQALASEWGSASRPVLATADAVQRAIVDHPHNPRGLAPGDLALHRRTDLAIDRFLEVHARFGTHRFHGRPNATDAAGYAGPLFWKEADVRFRFALELEREFAGQVHLDGLLNAATATEWDDELDGKTQHADIYVADHLGFVEGPDAAARFREQPASLLVEVKSLPVGRWATQLGRELEAIDSDVHRLGRHLDLGRSAVAIMLVADDFDAYAHRRNMLWWDHDVRLVCARPPSPLRTRQVANQVPFPWALPTERDVALIRAQADTDMTGEQVAAGALAKQL